jgi:hypothetical protein
MGNSEFAAIFAALGVFYLIFSVLYVFGYITMVFAITHSQKKRIVRGEDYTAGDFFLWTLGWGAVTGVSLGIAPIIYFFVKRGEMQATKQMCSQILANVRGMNMQQQQQQQMPPQHNPYQQ